MKVDMSLNKETNQSNSQHVQTIQITQKTFAPALMWGFYIS